MPEILPFKEIFSNKIFRIPDYQRGYSWEESQLEDLWADLTNIHLNNNAYHFTGILTINDFSDDDFDNLAKEGFNDAIDRHEKIVRLNDEEFKAYNLVDGQQRLTTILILLSQLNEKLRHAADKIPISRKYFFRDDDGTKYLFGYHVDVPSHNHLIHSVFGFASYPPGTTATLYTHNLDFAKKFFQKKLENYSPNNVRDLITKITERLLFSVLNLSEAAGTNLDISMVFETLNFRGKQLSGLERFKNRALYLLSKQAFGANQIASRRITINKTWLQIYKWLGRNPAPKSAMDDDAFLKAFWLLYFSNDSMVAKEFKAYQKNLFENDFNLLNINNNRYMMPDTLRKWLTCMRHSVVLWYFINNPYEVDSDTDFNYHYTPKIQRSLLRLHSFPYGYGRYMLNLILAVLVKLLPPKVEGQELSPEERENLRSIEDLLWAAERHNIMCFLFYGNKTNFNQEVIFREINKFFNAGNAGSIPALISTIVNVRVGHFNWDTVLRNITMGQDFANWDGIHFLLKEYDEHLSGEPVHREVAVNLIFPDDQNPSTRAFYSDINRWGQAKKRKYTYALGNLFMSNNTHYPRSFEEHKTRIQNAIDRGHTVYESEKELRNYPSWKTDHVIERTHKIIDFVVDKWSLPDPAETFKNYYN